MSVLKDRMKEEALKGKIVCRYAFTKSCMVKKNNNAKGERMNLNSKIYDFGRQLLDSESESLFTKIRVAFAFGIPVSAELKIQFDQIGIVQYDEWNRLYSFMSESLELNGTHKETLEVMFNNPLQLFYTDVIQFCETQNSPRSAKFFMEKFQRDRLLSIPPHVLRKGLKSFMKSVFVDERVEFETRVRVLFVLETVISQEMFDELGKFGTIFLDKRRSILTFRAHDGSFQLEKEDGKRAWTAGRKKIAPPRSRSRSPSNERGQIEEEVLAEEEEDDAFPLPVGVLDEPFGGFEEAEVEEN